MADEQKSTGSTSSEPPFQNVKVHRGMEVLLVKAALDPPFLEDLVRHRSKVAFAAQVQLSEEERRILDSVPEPQLRQMAASIRIPPEKADQLRKNLSGPGIVEYALILGVVGAIVIAGGTSSGGHIEGIFNTISGEISKAPSAEKAEVKSNFSGKPFDEAVGLMGVETGFSVQILSPESLDRKRRITVNTSGMTLSHALRAICLETGAPNFKVEMREMDGQKVIITFTDMRKPDPDPAGTRR